MSRKSKNSLPQNLDDRLRLIDDLKKKRAEIDATLEVLTGLRKEQNQVPIGFDYKDVIYKIFQDNSDKTIGLDDIVQQISSKYGFTPERDIVAKQTTLLVDRHKKVERIEGRRGKYRLLSTIIESNVVQNIDALKQ